MGSSCKPHIQVSASVCANNTSKDVIITKQSLDASFCDIVDYNLFGDGCF